MEDTARCYLSAVETSIWVSQPQFISTKLLDMCILSSGSDGLSELSCQDLL